MILKDSITEASRLYMKSLGDLYNWDINEGKLISGIELPDGNIFTKNLSLKYLLHNKWKQASSDQERFEIVNYYIKTWGGIRRIGIDMLEYYSTQSAENLMKLGAYGIASWSKAICVHDPDRYAIFDSRVSISLNSIQIIYNTSIKELFPILPSRNKLIQKANLLMKLTALEQNWVKIKDHEFYEKYLYLIREVANELDTNIATIEMFLFAFAEKFAESAFNME